jgi:hypothetical protein
LEIILYKDGTVIGLFSTYFGASHPGEDMICHVKESPWPKDPDKRPRQGTGSHNKKNRTFTLSVEGAKVEGKYDQNSIWGKGSGKNIFGGEGISFDIEIREFKLNRKKK